MSGRQLDQEEVPPEYLALLQQARELDFILMDGIDINTHEIDALEYIALRVWREEAAKRAPATPPKWGRID